MTAGGSATLRQREQLSRELRGSLAMILAGGVGSRLNVLVRKRAKPAVPFGGIYRLIDFTLSNVMNSGLERVGILTQYLPYSLTDHIDDGRHWGLVGRSREVRILPPHQGTRGSDWYLGTADAIWRNASYIHRHQPDLVVILSGDHVYNMDYAPMIDAHVKAGADASIAVRRVPLAEASSFGTIHVDAQSAIVGFEEKPKNPTSDLISMGIYVFSTPILLRRLESITGAGKGADFGHHIFPAMLHAGDRLFAYPWDGYWEDVGTIRAYFDSHMDLIRADGALPLPDWKVHTNLTETRMGDRPPAYFGRGAAAERSLVGRGCRIFGEVGDSILSPGVVVEPGASVHRSILMHDVRVEAGAQLENVILDKGTVIGREARLGRDGDDRPNLRFPSHLDSGITLIGKEARIGAGVRVGKNVVVFPQETVEKTSAPAIVSGETIGGDDA